MNRKKEIKSPLNRRDILKAAVGILPAIQAYPFLSYAGDSGTEGNIHVWEKVEIVLKAEKRYDNPYYNVDMGVDLEGPGFKKRCNGFWDGENIFRVRIMAVSSGTWKWKSWSNQNDSGLNNKSGRFTAVEWKEEEKESHPNRMGIIRATANGHALEYPDGTPFFLLGDTWWSSSTYRWKWRDDNKDRGIVPGMGIKEGAWFRKKQGFNCIAMIASFPTWINDGLPRRLQDKEGTILRAAWPQWGTSSPKGMHDEDGNRPFFSPGTCREYPHVVPDFSRVNTDYFKNLDRKISFLNEEGFVVFIEALRRDAGPSWKKYSQWPHSYFRYLRFLSARYQASQIIFSPLHYDSMNLTLSLEEWKDIIGLYFKKYGPPPFGQLISTNINFSTLERWGHTDTVPWLTMHQTGNNPRGHKIYDELTRIFNQKPPLPGLNGEPYYAGLKKETGGTEQDNRNARSSGYGNVLCGGLAGYIYGGQGLWSGNIENPSMRLKGDNTIWEALKFPSGAQMTYMKDFILSEGKKYREMVPFSDKLSSPRTGKTDFHQWSYCMGTSDKSLFMLYFEINCPPSKLKGCLLDGKYKAGWFDPRQGKWLLKKESILTADRNGIIILPEYPDGPGNSKKDWALKLIIKE